MIAKRFDFIKYLIEEAKINVNTMNMHTFWAPIHWACLYGETELI
jgi:hypothetical protein